MPPELSRRKFIVAGMGALAASASIPSAARPLPSQSESARLAKSPFRISVITDEISQDFGHACEIASQQFGMGWVEIRELWNKNSTKLDRTEIAEALRLLKKYNLKCGEQKYCYKYLVTYKMNCRD